MPANTSKYRPAERIGAHLALLLNTADDADQVTIRPFDLWRRLVRLLSKNSNYTRPLLGLSGGSEQDREHRATFWIDLVLDAERQTHAGHEHHAGHKLIAMLSNRSPALAPVELMRGPAPEMTECSTAVQRLRERLDHWDTDIETRTHKNGPPGLKIGGDLTITLPEALSIWGAIHSADPNLAKLDPETELAFIHFMARSVHGANKHWEMLAQLGLNPPAWLQKANSESPLETLTTNQARLAVKFVQTARAMSSGSDQPLPANWQKAWDAAPISKTLTFEAFSQTNVGRHLMSSSKAMEYQVDLDIDAIADGGELPELASKQDALDALNTLESANTVNAADLQILRSVLDGDSLDDIYRATPSLAARFETLESFLDHSDKIAEQVAQAVEQASIAEDI